MKSKLSSVMEDYLETIAMLKKRGDGVVRVRDISALLNVKSPTVNAALKTLSVKGYVVHERYGYVTLTVKGEEKAYDIQRKHDMLFKFLTDILGVDRHTASFDACKMEHAISPKTSIRLTKFIEFSEEGLNKENPQWLKNFKHYLETGKKPSCNMRKVKK
ncbi:MAG: metal-dependent transcriptional regulator [Candidatus Omnitrophota bacterium]|jgi:DtxR family Mn-dependent transcriptional regulator|nr:metal-dependent transcriptional regulator [Candidatus Omnitrophota bacterium]